MPSYLIDLLFWIVLLAALFVLIRWLQRRKADRDE